MLKFVGHPESAHSFIAFLFQKSDLVEFVSNTILNFYFLWVISENRLNKSAVIFVYLVATQIDIQLKKQ